MPARSLKTRDNCRLKTELRHSTLNDRHLRGVQNPREIKMSSKTLTAEQVRALCEALKECHEVALSYRRTIGDEDSIVLEQELRKIGDLFDLEFQSPPEAV
jgi:hypothetical protein